MGTTVILNWKTETEFEGLFRTMYAPLYRYACGLLSDDAIQAEEIVQDVFLKLWQQREAVTIETNISAYLYRAVHNQALNFLNHEKVKDKYQQFAKTRSAQYAESPAQKVFAKELRDAIAAAMQKIPEKCRTIFHLSRQEELSYREIAERLGLSVKTVENQMTKALKILRSELKDYLTTWVIAFVLFNLF